MAWSEKEVLDWIRGVLADDGLPERLHSTAMMIARDLLREPGRTQAAAHEVLARIYADLRPSMTDYEWMTYSMRKMTDRQLMEAIYRRVME